MSKRPHSSGSHHCSATSKIPEGDSASSCLYVNAPHCCRCSPVRRRRTLSPSELAYLYREHAAHYAHKFRAAIDYTIQEKPRQVISGGLLLLALYLIGFQDRLASWPAARDVSLPSSQQNNSSGDVPACALPVAHLSTAWLARDRAAISCSAHKNEEEISSNSERDVFSAKERPRAGLSDVKQNTGGKHVAAVGLSWKNLFPSSTGPAPPGSESVRRGAFAVIFLIAVYSFLQTKDGLLVRPHPGFWRVVHGVCLAHLLFMVWLLAVSPEVGKAAIVQLFPEISGKSKGVFAGTLVSDCRINVNTFYRQVSSVWFISHVMGWLGKMIILRDWSFCLLYSIAFEVVEVSFHWLVPELRECWWDSIFVDALLGNLSGMLLGVVLMKIVKLHQYDWKGRHSLYRKLVMRFNPFGGKYEWAFYKTPRHLGLTVVLLLLCVFTELNVFFLMVVLDIPAAHYSNPLRVIYLSLLGASAAAEHYEYTMHSQERIGHNEWLLAIILVVELMVCTKYGRDRIEKAVMPSEVWICWGLSLALFGIWCFCYFTTRRGFGLSEEKPAQQSVCELKTQTAGEDRLVTGAGRDILRNSVCRLGEVAKKQAKEEFSKRDGNAWWIMSWPRLQWYRERLRLLVLTTPPQACFLPLIYLSKFYSFDN